MTNVLKVNTVRRLASMTASTVSVAHSFVRYKLFVHMNKSAWQPALRFNVNYKKFKFNCKIYCLFDILYHLIFEPFFFILPFSSSSSSVLFDIFE